MISVVICTYNRSDSLETVLKSLVNQNLEKDCYEIVIIDGDSTDNTREIVERYMTNDNIHYYLEKRKGLSHARNYGWQVANGEYVAYIDDDCKAPTHWLSLGKEIIEKFSPSAFGGPYFAFYNTTKPVWFKDCYESHMQSKRARPLMEEEFLDGNNMFFSRSLFERVGGFDPDLGMTGKKLGYGEETDILRRIRMIIPKALIYYDPDLYVHHLVQSERMTMRWILLNNFVDGRYSNRIFKKSENAEIGLGELLVSLGHTFLLFLLDLGRSVFMRNGKKYPYVQNYLYEHTSRHINKLGNLYDQLAQKFEKYLDR